MESYQFSATQEGSAVAFSPGSTFIATATVNTIVVRSANTLQAVRQWTLLTPSGEASDAVDQIQWSIDGSRLLAVSRQAECAWVLDLSRDTPVACIESLIVESCWGDEDIRVWTGGSLMMYNLVSGRVKQIQQVHSATHAFSPDHRYMAILERHAGKTYVGIYDRESLIRHFPIQITEAHCLIWSPCGKWLALADWKLAYSVQVYSIVGSHVGGFSLPSAVLGIKGMTWSPNGRYLALVGYDGVARVIESEHWHVIATLRGFETSLVIKPDGDARDRMVRFSATTTSRPLEAKPSDDANGLGFSPDGAVLFFTHGASLHIYEFQIDQSASSPRVTHQLSVMFDHSITDAQFCPTSTRIAIVTKFSALYFWDRHGMAGVHNPEGYHFRSAVVIWAPDGKALALCDRTLYCLVYEESSEGGEEQWEDDLVEGDPISSAQALP